MKAEKGFETSKTAGKPDAGHVKFRHRFIYKTVGGMAPLILHRFHFKTRRINKKDEPYIVVGNHLTEVDMIMAGGAFAQHMYFVSGEHLLRTKNGWWMDWAQGPIYMFKGAPSIDTMRDIIKRIKAGNNVMIFPEGSRSFNGETQKLDTGIAKLVKMAGCALATFRIEGGYFVAPRWAYTTRTGPMKADVVNIYSSSDVAAMSRQELTDCINRDIYVNAYDDQRRNMYTYKGKRLAEGLENYLVRCSCCGAFDSMETEGDSFRCRECGQSGIYTPQGFLQGVTRGKIPSVGKENEKWLLISTEADQAGTAHAADAGADPTYAADAGVDPTSEDSIGNAASCEAATGADPTSEDSIGNAASCEAAADNISTREESHSRDATRLTAGEKKSAAEESGEASIKPNDSDILSFDSVYDWGIWSEKSTCEYIKKHDDETHVFEDTEVTLYEVSSDHKRTDILSGDVKGYKDRIEFDGVVFSFSDISGADMLYFGKTLVFTWKKRHMSITGEHFHAIKYQKLYEVFTGKYDA